MLKLDRPGHSARQTFVTCISRVQDPDLTRRLQAATQAVVDASTAFDAAAARQRLHEIARESPDLQFPETPLCGWETAER